MSLAYYLTEGRSILLSEDEILDKLKYCSDFIKSEKYLYRGNRSDFVYGYINPLTATKLRDSAWARGNFYNMMLSNFKSWSRYPKRDSSIVITSSAAKASSYGYIYYCIPYNGSKIGVCPEDDIWDSFALGSLGRFNEDLMEAFDEANIDHSWGRKGWNDFILICKYFDEYMAGLKEKYEKEIKRNKKMADFPNIKYKRIERLLHLQESGGYTGDLFKDLEKAFLPDKNHFSLIKAGDDIPYGCECWTDGECLLIRKYINPEPDVVRILQAAGIVK